MKVSSSLQSTPPRSIVKQNAEESGSPFEDVGDENQHSVSVHQESKRDPENTSSPSKAGLAVNTNQASKRVGGDFNTTTVPLNSSLPPLGPFPFPVQQSVMTNVSPGARPTNVATETRSALAPKGDTIANHATSPVSSSTQQSIPTSLTVERQVGGPRRTGNNARLPKRTPASTPPRPPAQQAEVSVGRSRSSDDYKRFKNGRDAAVSESLGQQPGVVLSSGESARSSGRSMSSSNAGSRPEWQWTQKSDPETQEQALFEQRLCEDAFGVAVRKINQNGKSSLRYIKCVPLEPGDTDDNNSTSRSVSSIVRTFSRRSQGKRDVDKSPGPLQKKLQSVGQSRRRALTWGKKKDHKLPLDRFVCVRKGKTTERTRKSGQPGSRLLSLVTNDKNNPSLDIEAPTKLDRDKFAKAFSRFLRVPLETDATVVSRTSKVQSVSSSTSQPGNQGTARTRASSGHSAPELEGDEVVKQSQGEQTATVTAASNVGNLEIQFEESKQSEPNQPAGKHPRMTPVLSPQSSVVAQKSSSAQQGEKIPSTAISGEDAEASGAIVTGFNPDDRLRPDDGSGVSSLTGAGFDQEIVEELHQALTEMKSELEASRAEAARAVKVAEQAIQSAENNSSKDWNSTVTHKAAEAAAQAQKKSAEAIAKQRLAEERLSSERKTAAFWRKQAEVAEEEAGALQTRAAVAEIQRAALAEELESERSKANATIAYLRNRLVASEVKQKEAYDNVMDRTRSLEIELDGTRRDLNVTRAEAKTLEDELGEVKLDVSRTKLKKLGMIGKKKRNTDVEDTAATASLLSTRSGDSRQTDLKAQLLPAEDVLKLHAEFSAVRLQFELLRRTTVDELKALPAVSQSWTDQASTALAASQAEINRLRERLARENATRMKLLHVVQDLKGVVRVYCRPKPYRVDRRGTILSTPSPEIVTLRTENRVGTHSLSFEFDRVFEPCADRSEVFAELEDVILSVLDGYKVCVLAFGQTGSGRRETMLGDVATTEEGGVVIENLGLQMEGIRQLFAVASQRSERYKDIVTMNIVEVFEERLCDLVAGTVIGGSRGRVDTDAFNTSARKGSRGRKRTASEDDILSQQGASTSSRASKNKLEIRIDGDGDTVVQGVVSVSVESFDEVLEVWKQSIHQRRLRVKEQGISLCEYESNAHVICTLRVTSTNLATGLGTVGKIRFAELASFDLTSRPAATKQKAQPSPSSHGFLLPFGNNREWRFSNKAISTLCDVVHCRTQFVRSVPYRNSTLTHLLQDSLESDTKVVAVACVSCNEEDLQETATTLRFAAKIRKVHVGKATKHSVNNN